MSTQETKEMQELITILNDSVDFYREARQKVNSPELKATFEGIARIVDPGTEEDALARELLVAKYREGYNLDEWGRTSLAVVIAFPHDLNEAAGPA